MTHSLVMRLSNSNPHTSGAQPPLPPKPAAHPRQSRRQENRSRLRGSPAANICATPAAIPTREYVRLQIGVKERCRPKAGALCHCPLPLPLPPTLPPPLALAAPPAVRTGAHRRTGKAACVFENVQRVYPTCEPRVSCVCVLTLCVPAPPVSLYDPTLCRYTLHPRRLVYLRSTPSPRTPGVTRADFSTLPHFTPHFRDACTVRHHHLAAFDTTPSAST